MKVSYTGPLQRLRKAAMYVNTLDGDEQFWKNIRDTNKFTYTELSSKEIERRIRSSTSTVNVKLHKFDDEKTVAATDPKYRHTIYYSNRNMHINRSIANMINTLVHEFVHNVDLFDDGEAASQMGHPQESTPTRVESAPYWIGDIAERRYLASKHFALREETEPFQEEFEIDPEGSIAEGETPLGEMPGDELP